MTEQLVSVNLRNLEQNFKTRGRAKISSVKISSGRKDNLPDKNCPTIPEFDLVEIQLLKIYHHIISPHSQLRIPNFFIS